MSQYRRARRLQETDAANQQHANREFRYFHDEDGSLKINARLPAEQGALVLKALEMALDRQFHNDDVSAETSEPEIRREPLSARRADAIAEVAETYLNTEPQPAATADRYQVVVHVSAETSHLEDGPRVSAETSRRIGCDCSRVRVEEDDDGEPLSIGRRSRSIPPAIRRALRFRDRGCRFPGCTRTRFVDGHHIRHWADGGETSLDNLVQLCRHHHRLVHEGGYACERRRDGTIRFRSPEGHDLNERQPRISDQSTLEDWFQFENTETGIDAQTCVTLWRGERIDWDLAVGALFQSPR